MTDLSPPLPSTAPGVSLDKHPRRIAGMFDAIAHRYDRLNYLLSAGLDRRWRRRAIDSINPPPGARILDACTGTADLALAACRPNAMPRFVLGVDFAGAMLELGEAKIQMAALERVVRLARGDACWLPCVSEAVEAVTIAFGIRNVQEPGQAIGEFFRVLKPGGRLAILEFGEPRLPFVRAVYLWYFRRVLPRIGRFLSSHTEAYAYLPASVSMFLSPEELGTLLRDTGFDEIRINRLTFGVVYLYVARKPPTR
ncbi:MAG: bifunctional demethylmenaquinone methyltransferase/2-methoxy-6-polyprenyl-1,4-benzoquinol methylase UbiE [Acidobacteriota bacterium]|nr:bifunctional demethylmenaquinone methyltransferase/2-methoxy-6-polyprenyl-1,4-benzoquinol methylase UbiE [Acidobacteriota bacterium]